MHWPVIRASRGVRENVPLAELLKELGWVEHASGNWEAPDLAVLSPEEVQVWLTNKGWSLERDPWRPSDESESDVPALKWARGKKEHGYEGDGDGLMVVGHYSKCGLVRITKKLDGHIPIYVVDVRGGPPKAPAPGFWSNSQRIKPPRYVTTRSDEQYDGWWRLRDAKQAAAIVVAHGLLGYEGSLPTTGKRPSLPNYGTYDTSEGFGNPEQWKATMNARMGRAEAERVLGGNDPLDLLVSAAIFPKPNPVDLAAIKKLYRKAVALHHPDKGGDAATFREVQAAYELLEEQYK